jgi:integrase
MAIHDRWHKNERDTDGQRTGKQVRTAEYGCEHRWQVRWRDEAGRQRKKAFARKAAAEQFDATIKTQLAEGSYIDPAAGQVTFRSFAEDWRRNRMHDLSTAGMVEANFRNHAYSADGRGGRTPMGGVSIGDFPMKILGKRPSLVQAWIAGLPLDSPNTRRLIVSYVGQVFKAAVADRVIASDPMKSSVIRKPQAVRTPAIPWTAAQLAAVAGELKPRLAAIPYLGAACGLRQGELFAVALDDLNFQARTLHIEVQVKEVRGGGGFVFAPLKNHRSCRSRDVPLEEPVLSIVADHIRKHPPIEVTLPWATPGGKPATRKLIFTEDGRHLIRGAFNYRWRKAWRAAGVPDRGRLNGMHVLRHTAASAWLSAGLNPAKVAAYLGDTPQVLLSTYAHFLPVDDDRARTIMSEFFRRTRKVRKWRPTPRRHRLGPRVRRPGRAWPR